MHKAQGVSAFCAGQHKIHLELDEPQLHSQIMQDKWTSAAPGKCLQVQQPQLRGADDSEEANSSCGDSFPHSARQCC